MSEIKPPSIPPKSREFHDQKFKPGQSGNPKGRPKGAKNRSTVIRNVLSEMVPAQLGGKKRNIATSEAAIRVLTQKALKGDIGAIRDVIQLWAETEEAAQAAHGTDYPFSDTDREVIAEIYTRMNGRRSGAGS